MEKYSEVFERVVSCEQFDRRIARYLIELGCKENVRRNVRYLIELRAVRSLFGEMRGIR